MLIPLTITIISLCIAMTAVCGDAIESKVKIAWALAIVDNATHALIGCFSWLSVAIGKSAYHKNVIFLKEVLLCGFLASCIDLDHFLSASSWKLADATHLRARPFMHNTSLVIGLSAVLLILERVFFKSLSPLAWIFATAGISHHIRDATRRGLWMWPFGSTPPIPYVMYVALLMVFPVFMSKLLRFCWVPNFSSSHVDLV